MRGILLILLIFLGYFGQAQPSSDPITSYTEIKSPSLYVINGRMGLQKNLHKPITPAVYDTLYSLTPSRYIGKRFNSTKQQSYWGIIDAGGNQVVPFKYSVLKICGDVVIVGLSEHNLIKYGAFLIDGDKIINPQYEFVNVIAQNLITAKNKTSISIFNNSGEKITQFTADSISSLAQGYLKINLHGKSGIANLGGKMVTDNIFQDIKLINNEVWVKKFAKWQIITGYDTLSLNYENVIDWQKNFIVATGTKSMVINENTQVLSASYDSIHKINNKLAFVINSNKWGAINNSGKEIIPVRFTEVFGDEEMIYAKNTGNNNKWSLFDHYGFGKTKLKYDAIKSISQGRIAIERKGKWGFLDRYGVEVIAPIYDKVKPFERGVAVVNFFGEDGLIDRSGKWVMVPSPIKILAYDNNTILGKVQDQYQIKKYSGELVYFTRYDLEMTSSGFLERDSSGVILRRISWSGTYEYYNIDNEITMTGGDGLLIFKANGKYGFKDQRRRIIVANRYEAVKPFHQRLAAIKINNKWGFINRDEQIIIQPRYDEVGYFNEETCITKKSNLFGVINLKGEEIIPNEYQQIKPLGNGQFIVQKNGEWGVLDKNGATVIHTKYDYLKAVNQNFYIVAKNGKYGTIDSFGVNKIPLIFDFIGYNNDTKTMITKMVYKNEWTFLKKVHSLKN
jgi:WG repeat protein